MNKLKHYRKLNGISQEKLARAVDIGLRYYQLLEKGIHSPSVYLAIRICDFLNITDLREVFPIQATFSSKSNINEKSTTNSLLK